MIKKLPDDLLSLMQTADEHILTQLRVPNSDQEKKRSWFAIVFSHPQLSYEILKLIKKQLKLSDESEFECTASWGNLSYFKYLINEYEQKNTLQNMIAWDDYRVFINAAKNGHLELLLHLETKAPDMLQAMIEAGYYGYDAFRSAAAGGYLDVLRYLEKKAPDKLQKMIATHLYDAFSQAATNSRLEVLLYLEERVRRDKLQEMIAAWQHHAFRGALLNEHVHVVNHLLGYPAVFAFAEFNTYGVADPYIHPLIAETLSRLRTQKQELEQQSPIKYSTSMKNKQNSYSIWCVI